MSRLAQVFVCSAIGLIAGCVQAPSSEHELLDGAVLDGTSTQGLARGRLSALHTVEVGSNDFDLELSATSPQQAAVLDDVEAVMPSHGHRAVPTTIEPTTEGYRIVSLALGMSGAWQLRGSLVVEGRADQIAFDIDVP